MKDRYTGDMPLSFQIVKWLVDTLFTLILGAAAGYGLISLFSAGGQ
jgi:hypothetical protein